MTGGVSAAEKRDGKQSGYDSLEAGQTELSIAAPSSIPFDQLSFDLPVFRRV